MGELIQKLRRDVSAVQSLMEKGTLFSFSPEEKRALLDDSLGLLRKVEQLEECALVVGLMGGTGVGKSTIMNALAGSEISSAGHRRPHTDRAIVYRHHDVAPPESIRRSTVPWREATHEVDTIRRIILCDLPDFDSLVGEHRARVLLFLDHLDMLIWVTSPEKYADLKFYDLLKDVPKARANYYFVLNKADILFDGRPGSDGYAELEKITGRFRRHLVEHGIEEPIIYTVSAHEAFGGEGPSGWNQFIHLKHQVFQLRDGKEVAAIKAANLDVEVGRFVDSLRKESVYLRTMRGVLSEFVDEMKGERERWIQTGAEYIGLSLAEYADGRDLSGPRAHPSLPGPSYIVGSIMGRLHDSSGARDVLGPTAALFPAEGPISALRRCLERLKDRAASRFLILGLPSSFVGRLDNALDMQERWEALIERFHALFRLRLEAFGNRPATGFRLFQYLVFSILTVSFVLAIGGREGAFRSLMERPGLSSLAGVIVNAVAALFSPEGLAALTSFVLLQAYLGVRFYGYHKKSLQRRTQKFIESVKLDLTGVWEEELHSVTEELNGLGRELEDRLSEITSLWEARREG